MNTAKSGELLAHFYKLRMIPMIGVYIQKFTAIRGIRLKTVSNG